MNETHGELEINLKDVLSMLLKRWWLILIVTILCGALMYMYASYTYVPKYKATAKMYVNNDNSSKNSQIVSISTSDIAAAQALVNTYCVILESRSTLETVIEKAELGYTYEQLLSMIDCGAVNETEVLYISVTCNDAGEAKAIVNAIVRVLPDKISETIDGTSTKTIDEAVEGTLLSSGISTKTMIGLLLGFVIACVFFFVSDIVINDTISGDEWIIEAYNGDIPLLSVIPDVNTAHKHRRGYYYRSNYSSDT